MKKSKIVVGLALSALASGVFSISIPAVVSAAEEGPPCVVEVPPAPVPVQILKICPGLR